ncbi:MAG: NAD(P)/FAD-dependent oxidoreductase [Chloroflexota bacterium]|nr:NAD(P)/FAD-dependent oxidoreductase [Chloroflexota bacterium]
MSQVYDAIVVGAGPVGSRVAYQLAHYGHKVLVVERHSNVGDAICCTGIVGKECLERFPVANSVVTNHARSATFISPSGKCLRMQKDTVQAYVVERTVYDCDLASQAQEEGAEYLLSARVNDITLVDHRVRAEVTCNGRSTDIESNVVIIGSGFGTQLPRKLSMGNVGDFVLGAQAEVAVREADETEVYFGQNIAPGFFAWLVPTSPGRALAGLLTRSNPGAYLNEFLASLAAQGKIESPDAQITRGGIPLKPLPRTYGQRVLVVGDAAGQVKPTTGGGIYYGLLCADIAADTVHTALLSDDFSAKNLARYEKDWKNMLGSELRVDYWARKLYEKLNDSQIERIFDIVQSNNIHEDLLQSPDFSFDWHGVSITRALRHRTLRKAIWTITRSVLPF